MLRTVLFCMFVIILATGYGQVGKVLFSEARAVPKILNYQGYLTDTLGSPIDDTLDMTFKIYDAATLGNELWNETQLNVPVERGVFSVLLGSGTPVPDTVFTTGTDRWLELTLEGPQTLLPRTRITAMGYAYTSTYSDTAEYAKNAATDNDWVRGTPDSVLFTANYLGVSRGSANNMLYGDSVHTHTNFGVACTTGLNGFNRPYITISGGSKNTARGDNATVGGGKDNTASGNYATVGGGVLNDATHYATVGGGDSNSASDFWAIVGGGCANAASYHATVGGGFMNTASGDYATIGGGGINTASGDYATVGGGWADTVNATYGGAFSGRGNLAGDESIDTAAVVVGGWNNSATGEYSFVGGGKGNSASGPKASVSGGLGNIASGNYATVGGGYYNTADNDQATIGGGYANTASNQYTTVAGGIYNVASGPSATVAGGSADTVEAYCGGILSGFSNLAGDASTDTAAVVVGGWNNSAIGGHSFVGGGRDNTASGNRAIVVGGRNNTASGSYATVGGGYGNVATSSYVTVSGGNNNTASGIYAAVGGGYGNVASNSYVTVGGGYFNTASGYMATVGGGYRNTADSIYATVAGGRYNSASERYTTIAGGYSDTVYARYGGVLSGYGNLAGDESADTAAVVVGGWNNSATGRFAFVGGGDSCTASGTRAIVVGGHENTASATCATVVGGSINSASGNWSSIAGGFDNTCAALDGFVANSFGDVLSGHSNSTSLNGQTTTASGQTRVGALSKSSGTFTIDHPLDPMNTILNHYFVESPEMVLIYRGTAKIGADGRAEIHLPDYFDALNKNPMVQLTGVGTSDVFVADEVGGNRFVIGGKPGTKVYWTVTGERKDPSAEITKILMPVEQPKDGDLAGRSLDDDFLASTRGQLEQMGKAARFQFRTQQGRERYENMKRRVTENR